MNDLHTNLHGNLPKARQLKVARASTGELSTAMSEAIVESVGPERVSRVGVWWKAGGEGRVVIKAIVCQDAEGLESEVQEWSTEALDGRSWDARPAASLRMSMFDIDSFWADTYRF